MARVVIQSQTQKRHKDSIASSPLVGLAVRANGEEKTSVIDANGKIYRAGIPAPLVPPSLQETTSGNLTANKWIGYVYCYAATKFNFVENALSINGSLAPRGNPSEFATLQIGGSNARVEVTVTKIEEDHIDEIWIFRTEYFDSQIEAETAAEAGQVFYIGTLPNDGQSGTETFEDNSLNTGIDQIELDNYEAPTFQFVVYSDPYWWGIGNREFRAPAEWENTHTGSTALITLTGNDTWFDGRDGQFIKLEGVETGGIDGEGTFLIKILSDKTATVYLSDENSPVSLPSETSGEIIVKGHAATLYRSKPRNPFSWGWTEVLGAVNVPQLYAFRIGGGEATALAVLPNGSAMLKMDFELPSQCFTLNLKAAGTLSFESTLRCISDFYSVTAHHSQFTATKDNGSVVLWGLDVKNFCILECDGVSQRPVPNPLFRTLRAISRNKFKQRLAHGVYDPRTETNCLWIPSNRAMSLCDILIYQHVPTGTWGVHDDKDVLSSAIIQDENDGINRVFVGTQTGLLGQAFSPSKWDDWQPEEGQKTGIITDATSLHINIQIQGDGINVAEDGVVGSYCLVTDENDGQEQWGRVAEVSQGSITFDSIRPYNAGTSQGFNPIPQEGWKFYLGVIDSQIFKSIDLGSTPTDKQLLELWLAQQNVDTESAGTLIRFYKEQDENYTQFATLQNKYQNNLLESVAWFNKQDIPSELVKFYSIKIINRGYTAWNLINVALKHRIAP